MKSTVRGAFLKQIEWRFRQAQAADLPVLVALLADDALGKTREIPQDPLPAAYREAFAAIEGDENNQLWVAHDGQMIGAMLQLTYLPSLTYGGRWRAQIEGVRVKSDLRGQGLGRMVFQMAIEKARARGCCMVQLTTDKRRPQALAFYRALGFQASHEGMKLHL